MSNRDFVADVIYGLKVEYGEEILVGTHNWTTNQQTGVKTDAPSTFLISMAIPLPENLRESFFKSIGAKMEGRLQKGQREFLIDKSDIPCDEVIVENKSWINFLGKSYDVQRIDDYDYAMIVIGQAVTGNPLSPNYA